MRQEITYKTRGTCSRLIYVEIEDGIIRNVTFDGGCSGNTNGISALVVGMTAEEAIKKMKGIRCGPRSTSCPDQLAQAIEACLAQTEN